MAGEGYIGAGGQKFMSSALARASQPGGYTRTISRGQPKITALSRGAQLAFGKALEQFKPGGAYGKGVEAALERGRTKAIAGGQQALVSAGLAGTSMMAAPGLKFEEETAMPIRAKVEETRAGRLSEIYSMLAEAEQRGFESAEERTFRTQMMPRYSMPTMTPVAENEYAGMGSIPAPDFSLPVSNRIASAMQRIKPPIGSPAALWAAGTWGKSLEAERTRAGV
jgi:hypothetical protein